MAKYQKLPLEIEAVQWHQQGDSPWVRRTDYGEIAKLLGTSGCSREEPYWSWEWLGIIETPEGPHVVIPEDWIITGIAGEHYPCRDTIFRMSYAPVPLPPAPEPPTQAAAAVADAATWPTRLHTPIPETRWVPAQAERQEARPASVALEHLAAAEAARAQFAEEEARRGTTEEG